MKIKTFFSTFKFCAKLSKFVIITKSGKNCQTFKIIIHTYLSEESLSEESRLYPEKGLVSNLDSEFGDFFIVMPIFFLEAEEDGLSLAVFKVGLGDLDDEDEEVVDEKVP